MDKSRCLDLIIHVHHAMLHVYMLCVYCGTHLAVVSVTTKLTNDLPNESKNWKTVVGSHVELGYVGKLGKGGAAQCVMQDLAHRLVRVEEEQVACSFSISRATNNA